MSNLPCYMFKISKPGFCSGSCSDCHSYWKYQFPDVFRFSMLFAYAMQIIYDYVQIYVLLNKNIFRL